MVFSAIMRKQKANCGEKYSPDVKEEDLWRRQRPHRLPHEVRGCGFDDVKDFAHGRRSRGWGRRSQQNSTKKSRNQRHKFVLLPPLLTNYVDFGWPGIFFLIKIRSFRPRNGTLWNWGLKMPQKPLPTAWTIWPFDMENALLGSRTCEFSRMAR